MEINDLISALDLPARCRVDQRVPKKLLLENGANTSTDKRNINERVEEIQWLASLKPSTVGIPEFRDEIREYLEVVLLHLQLRKGAKVASICELTHRAIPYPLFLLVSEGDQLFVSLAHIRWAQNEANKVVLDEAPLIISIDTTPETNESLLAFMNALSIKNNSRENLKTLYQGWWNTLIAYEASQITGVFSKSQTDEQAKVKLLDLEAFKDIQRKILSLRMSASKEKQLSRQISVNLEIKGLEGILQDITKQL